MLAVQREFDGLSEASLYHKGSFGYFAVLWRDQERARLALDRKNLDLDLDDIIHARRRIRRMTPSGIIEVTADDLRAQIKTIGNVYPMVQRCYPVTSMSDIIRNLPKDRDTYISQAEFTKQNRRLVNLARIGLCFADIDYYKSKYANMKVDALISLILMHLSDNGLPWPSLILDSGRGLQIKWLLSTAIPRAALPRWNAVQRHLVGSLNDFGADHIANSGSQVLRLVDTVNTKSNTVVEVVWTNKENGELVMYDFDFLADTVLPFTRDEIRNHMEEMAERGGSKEQPFKLIKGKYYGLRRFSAAQLNWDRLEDMRRIADLRGWQHGNPPGHRDSFIFHGTICLAHAGTPPNTLHLEAVSLAKEFAPTWGYAEIQRNVGAVVRKAKENAAGQRIEHNGKRYTPLYTPKNHTLIDALGITDEEMRQLKTIITKDEKRRRDGVKKVEERRAAGMVPREDFLARADAKGTDVLRLHAEGHSQRQIASALSISVGSVNYHIKKGR